MCDSNVYARVRIFANDANQVGEWRKYSTTISEENDLLSPCEDAVRGRSADAHWNLEGTGEKRNVPFRPPPDPSISSAGAGRGT